MQSKEIFYSPRDKTWEGASDEVRSYAYQLARESGYRDFDITIYKVYGWRFKIIFDVYD